MEANAKPRSIPELSDWLTRTVAGYVQCEPSDIATDVPLSEYGLDSVSATTVCADIEDDLGLYVEVMLIWDHPTIGELSKALADQLASAAG